MRQGRDQTLLECLLEVGQTLFDAYHGRFMPDFSISAIDIAIFYMTNFDCVVFYLVDQIDFMMIHYDLMAKILTMMSVDVVMEGAMFL